MYIDDKFEGLKSMVEGLIATKMEGLEKQL